MLVKMLVRTYPEGTLYVLHLKAFPASILCSLLWHSQTLNVTYMGLHVRTVTETYYMLGKY